MGSRPPTGVNEASRTSYTYLRVEDSADFIFWLFADLDHVFVVTKLVSTYYGHYGGLLKRFLVGAVALTQAAVTAGSGVVLQVNDATVVTPGQDYVIKDDAGIERVRVSAIDTAVTPNTITVRNPRSGLRLGGQDRRGPAAGRQQLLQRAGHLLRREQVRRLDFRVRPAGPLRRGQRRAPGRNRSGDALRHHHPLFPGSPRCPGSAAYQELRGELIEIFSVGGGNVASEDTIQIGTDSYRVFNLTTGGWCAVKE